MVMRILRNLCGCYVCTNRTENGDKKYHVSLPKQLVRALILIYKFAIEKT